MTQKTRTRFRIISLVAVLAIATGTVLWVSAQTTEETSENEAAEQASTEAVEQEAGNETENEAEAEEDEEVAVPVEVAEVTTGAITSYISATANLVAEDQVKVLSEAEGRIERLLVEEGDMVSSGQVLAVLVQDEAKIALSKVELKASNAKAALERAEGTHDQGLISAEAFDKLKMEYEVARQEVAEAEWLLAKTVIRAPFSACVTERFITQGQHLRPGDELFTVADYDPMVARIYLPESDVLELEVALEAVELLCPVAQGRAQCGRNARVGDAVLIHVLEPVVEGRIHLSFRECIDEAQLFLRLGGSVSCGLFLRSDDRGREK